MTAARTETVSEICVLVDRRQGDPRRHRGNRQLAGSPGRRLHERDAALAEMRGVLGGTFDHPWVPIVIEGRTGTGTTALLNAILEMGRELELRIGRARCNPSESSAPFAVVRQVFSSMRHHSAFPDEPMHDGADLARRVLGGGFVETDDPVEVYQSLILLLETIGEGPTLVAVDDVQWADSMSAGWLQFLARRLKAASVHLVVTTLTRRAAVPCPADPLILDPATRRLILHPLGLDSTAAMLSEHFGANIDQSVSAAAHRVTGGNPLLIARLLSTIDDRGIASSVLTERQIATLASPVVAQRVLSLASTLGTGALEFVETAAILGSVDLSVATAVAGVEAERAGRLADALADVGVLGWGSPIEFVHPLEQCSVAKEIQPARRAEVHAHAAHVLAVLGGPITETATHLLESDPRGDPWATSVLLEAAQHHIKSGDAELAARLLERADREATGDQRRAEIAGLRARVDGQRGRESSVEHLCRAARLGLDPAIVAVLALDLLDQQRDPTASAEILEVAQRTGDHLPEVQPHVYRLLLAEAVLVPARARHRDEVRPIPYDDPAFASSSTGRLLTVHRGLCTAGQLNCTHDQLIDIVRKSLTSDALFGGGFVQSAIAVAALSTLVRIGAYEIADPLLGAAMTEARTAGRRFDTTTYAVILAESLAMQGRILAAERLLAEVEFGDRDRLEPCATMQRRWFAALRERPVHQPPSTQVIPSTVALGLAEIGVSAAMFVTETLARVQLLEGDFIGALANFDRLGSAAAQCSVRNPAFVPWRAGRSAALAGLGRSSEGAAAAEENLELARAFGSPITIAEALACVARFQPPEAQVALLSEAIDAISHTSAELLRCHLLIDLGFARHHAGDAHAARTAFRDGADHATRFGVTRLAGVAGRGLLACGARPRRLQTSGLESLTPAELRVVTLAVAGHTNTAIAESLFINVKTVESHLTRVYKKLGISDRAELKAALESADVAVPEVPRAG